MAGYPDNRGMQVSTFDDEQEVLELAPEEDVYHYLMFMVPIEQQKALRNFKRGGCNWGIMLAYAIVILSVLVQSIFLAAIWNSIVKGDIDWQLSVYRETEDTKCNTGGALCFKDASGEYSCAPPSVQIATRWDELDLDGDGVWTREEVKEHEETLNCKYAVNPVEVFDVFSKMAVERSDILWVHPDVRAGTAIPKAYFDFAAGDIIHCAYRTTDMCPNLLMRGTWDAPLKYNTSPRVGNTIDSALQYCINLLKDGGYCDRLLPSTYAVWKKSTADQCSGAEFNKVVYEHPTNGKTKSLLAVDYASRQDFRRDHKDRLFHLYKMCIVGIYILAMLYELKAIIVFATVVTMFPAGTARIDDDPEQGEEFVLDGISSTHRCSMTIIVLVRIVMLTVLTVVGLMFLEKTMSVLDLLLNGLGLLFIVEISTIMCGQIVNQFLRGELEKCKPMRIPMIGPKVLNRNPALKDFLWLMLLVFGIVVTSVLYKEYIIMPTSEALTCACLSEGKTCREAKMFDGQFWREYWNEQVPAVFESVEEMKADHRAQHAPPKARARTAPAPSAAQEAAPAAAPVAQSLVSSHKHHSRQHKKLLNNGHHDYSLLHTDKYVTVETFGSPTA